MKKQTKQLSFHLFICWNLKVDHEVAVSVASKGGDHRAKKRRLSSINNSPENKLELPKDLQVTQDKEQQQQHEEADVNDDAPSEDTGL